MITEQEMGTVLSIMLTLTITTLTLVMLLNKADTIMQPNRLYQLLDNYNQAESSLKRFRQEHYPVSTVIKYYKDNNDFEIAIVVGHTVINPTGIICQKNNEQTTVVRMDAKIIVIPDVDNYPLWVKIALGL